MQSKIVVAAPFVIAAVGGTVFWVIVITSVSVQPFAAVAVTVYVPGVVMVKAAALPTFVVPFDHAYVKPPFAFTLMLVCVQVSTFVFEALKIPATGVVMFWVMVLLAVDVQPLAPVTVTV